MDIRPNCSSDCESGSCYIHPAVNSQQSWDILLRLCTLSTKVVEVQSRSLSPVLCAVVWTLLSCGILLSLLFFIFTMRYKNNRIVKMSSPNLNVLTLIGSILTYTSGFLFAIEGRSPVQGTGPRAVLQVRVWTLCVGSTLVFGPILGKTWRLYRVFTQRVPDRRVIIRDILLIGLVTLLIAVDVVLLTAWSLSDPVKCSRSVSAMVKVVEFDVHYSMSQLDSCSSQYSDLWIILMSAVKGSLLLYGTYLAGLTSDVSLPPVNQSLTIVAAVCLVTTSTAVAVPISRYLYTWPNLVYSVVSGSIFICTTAINCLLFVPQLTQWRQFEEEVNTHPSQMAKYFSSPSKSLHSVYSEDEIYYLLGENDSMKRLISEKNAVIDSLQVQVNNAKDKLLRLMSVSHLQDEGEMDSSLTNLNSTSTQTTVVPPERPSSPVTVRTSKTTPPTALSPPPYVAPPSLPSGPLLAQSYPTPPTKSQTAEPGPLPPLRGSSPPLSSHSPEGASQNSQAGHLKLELAHLTSTTEETPPKLNNSINSGCISVGLEPSVGVDMPPNPSVHLNKSQGSTALSSSWPCPVEDAGGSVEEPVAPAGVPGGGRQGFVSSEQLQEILQDLSVDAISSSLRSPGVVRRPSNPVHDDLNALITFSPLSPLSPRSPLQFHLPSISPYMMRKRRPPFNSSRAGPPPYYYPGSAPPGCRRGSAPPGQERLRERDTTPDSALSNSTQPRDAHDNQSWGEEEDEVVEGSHAQRDSDTRSRLGKRGSRRACRRSSSVRRPGSPFAGQATNCGLARDADGTKSANPYEYSDTESSSSEDYCYYHRPYCEACRHTHFASSQSSSTSETSDSEFEDLYHSSHPVVNFKEDLKPTFV